LYDSLTAQYCTGTSQETSPKGGPCRKAEQVFYAYCRKNGIDYTKSKPRAMEAFQWTGDLTPEESGGRLLIRGRAIHPCKTYHPGEWPQVRVYLEEELKASAPSLAGKSLLLDHAIVLNPPNRVLKAQWEDGAVEYVAEVSKPIYDLIKNGEIHCVSIEYDWRVLEKLNGIAPRDLELTGLSLLRHMQPGDPATSAQVWEGIIKKMNKRNSQGEGVVEPTAPKVPQGYVKAEEVLAILPKQVPYGWGAGPHELVRRLRAKCSQSN